MAELEEKLNQILSNPDSMKKVMDLASGLMSAQQNNNAASQQASSPQSSDLSGLLGSLGKGNASTAPPAASGGGGMDLSTLLASLSGKKGGTQGGENGEEAPSPGEVPAPGGFDMAVLPKLMQAFSGDTNYLKQEKVNLLRALKPYFGQRRGPEIDRAVKVANLARAAQDTLGGFLRR